MNIVGRKAYHSAEKAVLKYMIDNFETHWENYFLAARKSRAHANLSNVTKLEFTEEEKNNPFLTPLINALDILAAKIFPNPST